MPKRTAQLTELGALWLASNAVIPIVVITLLVVLLATPLLMNLPFDFNPTHLQDPNDESVKTFLELKNEPQTGANAIEIETPDSGSRTTRQSVFRHSRR
jgi:hypothetical protein